MNNESASNQFLKANDSLVFKQTMQFLAGINAQASGLESAGPSRHATLESINGGPVEGDELDVVRRGAPLFEGAMPMDRIGLEAIVRVTGRPPLIVQDGQWEDPVIPELRTRLSQSAAVLLPAIAKVARIEVLGHALDYIGTGWMVDTDILITNRHVAQEFVRRQGQSYHFLSDPLGNDMKPKADFLQEYQRPAVSEFVITEALHIEDPSGPDMAFFRVEGTGLPAPLELATTSPNFGDNVVTIGYPAQDPRNDFFVMMKYFKNIFGVKRLAPGLVTGADSPQLLLHDCTTLGGNSGSVVVSCDTGKAVGLHFSGSYKTNNFAVKSSVIAARLATLSRQRTVAPQPAAGAGGVVIHDDSEARRVPVGSGYDENFLGGEIVVPVPGMSDALATERTTVDGSARDLLDYPHFSIAMHKTRRLAMFTACNIDGAQRVRIRRGQDNWQLDPRLADGLQIGNELYRGNRIDRGHLVRREDPVWGTEAEAEEAEKATFVYSNSAPQHEALNQRDWLALEDYVLQNADKFDLKVCVLTGPVFKATDKEYRNVPIPEEFWKVVATVNPATGGLSVTGYLLSQVELLDELEFVYGAFRTYQISLTELETRTGLTFDTLKEFDPLNANEARPRRQIRGAADVLI